MRPERAAGLGITAQTPSVGAPRVGPGPTAFSPVPASRTRDRYPPSEYCCLRLQRGFRESA